MADRRLNKRLVAIVLITITSLIIAIVALSQSYPRLYPTTTPQSTIVPTATPTATPNLSSAKPDNDEHISIDVTALNIAHRPPQWDPLYYIHISNSGDSSLTVISIICTEIDDQTNFIYWNGTQAIAPHTVGNFTDPDTYTHGLPMNDIYVYYQVSGQLFVHSLAHVPLPTYSP